MSGQLTAETVLCEWCGSAFDDPAERDDPRRDANGEPICDQCYEDEFQYRCCWCGEYEEIEHRHKLVVVAEPQGFRPRIYRGIYRIVSLPYYADGMIQGWLFAHALKKICPLPEGIDTRDYPCGHLCRECQQKVEGGK